MIPATIPWRIIIVAAFVAALIYWLLVGTARTPRACANIMQVASILFFLAVIIRQKMTQAPEPFELTTLSASRHGIMLAFAIGAGVWASTVPLCFISDDFAHLYSARQPVMDSLWEALTRGQAATFLRPIGFASLLLDYRLWQEWAPGYHITNLAIHVIGVIGLFSLCKYLAIDGETSVTASVIYAVLPVEAEAIAWMSARFDLLSASFTIWSVALFVKFRKDGSNAAYLAALCCFILAALSKENAFVLPFVLLAAESLVMPERRLKPVLGLFISAAALFAYRWQVLGGIGGYPDASGHPATFNIGFRTLEGVLIRGPGKLLLGYNWHQPPLAVTSALAALTGALLLVLAFSFRVGPLARKRILFSLAWMIITILPAHPLLLIGPALTNSRVLYLGSAGLAILIAQLSAGIPETRNRRAMIALLTCLLSLGALHNLAAWRWTCSLSRQFLYQLNSLKPSPPVNTRFEFLDVPEHVRGVFLFANGLPEAVKILYAREDINSVRGPETALPAEIKAPGKKPIRIRWFGRISKLIQEVN